MHTKFWSDGPREDHTVEISIDVTTVLKSIVVKYGAKLWAGLIWLKFEPNGGFRELNFESLCSLK